MAFFDMLVEYSLWGVFDSGAVGVVDNFYEHLLKQDTCGYSFSCGTCTTLDMLF